MSTPFAGSGNLPTFLNQTLAHPPLLQDHICRELQSIAGTITRSLKVRRSQGFPPLGRWSYVHRCGQLQQLTKQSIYKSTVVNQKAWRLSRVESISRFRSASEVCCRCSQAAGSPTWFALHTLRASSTKPTEARERALLLYERPRLHEGLRHARKAHLWQHTSVAWMFGTFFASIHCTLSRTAAGSSHVASGLRQCRVHKAEASQTGNCTTAKE